MLRSELTLLTIAASLAACRGRAAREPKATPSLPAAALAQVRYLKGQLHLHSSRSGDSRTPAADVVRWYREHGYDFVVFTDHNRTGAPTVAGPPLVLSGIELTQNSRDCVPPPEPGDVCLFHANAVLLTQVPLGFDPWRPTMERPLDRLAAYRRALSAGAALGGIVQLNHPGFHHAVDVALLVALARDGLRFFEVANGSFDAQNDGDARHPSTEAMWDQALTAGAWLFGTATDDAHHYYDAPAAAAWGEPVYTGDRGFVMVRAALDADSIRAAMLRGDFYASSGVLLDRVQLRDGRLSIDVAAGTMGDYAFTWDTSKGATPRSPLQAPHPATCALWSRMPPDTRPGPSRSGLGPDSATEGGISAARQPRGAPGEPRTSPAQKVVEDLRRGRPCWPLEHGTPLSRLLTGLFHCPTEVWFGCRATEACERRFDTAVSTLGLKRSCSVTSGSSRPA